jgi:hypothetical protein
MARRGGGKVDLENLRKSLNLRKSGGSLTHPPKGHVMLQLC